MLVLMVFFGGSSKITSENIKLIFEGPKKFLKRFLGKGDGGKGTRG